MSTVFGIVLFVLVYGSVAYMIYDELTGRRSRVRSLLARGAGRQRVRRHPQLTSR